MNALHDPRPQGLTPAQAELRSVINERQLLVCVGSGGVGKTTTAAAIAIQAAIEGRRAIVVTIDPAKRLANSLGLEALGNEEKEIALDRFAAHGVTPKGTLHAMMLDTERTFDDLITRMAKDDESRDRVLNNRIYQHISDTLSASHDYMASEKLYDLHHSGKYDLVVLDTPPMKNAIDFLEASGKLSRFLDDRIVSWFLKPHDDGKRRLGTSLLQAPGAIVYRLLGTIFGNEFLDEIAEFFLATADMLSGFRERAEVVSKLLRDGNKTRFAIVCTPRSTSMEEARYFHRQLIERGMPGNLFVVNQVGRFGEAQRGDDHRYLHDADRAWIKERLKGQATDKELTVFVEKLEGHFDRSVAIAQDDRKAIEGLRAYAGRRVHVATVPRLPEDVHDLAGLLALDAHLFGQDE